MKQHKTRNILLLVGTVLTAILAIIVIVVATQLQKKGSTPVAPTAPESKPQAAIPASCQLSFDVLAGSAECLNKLAYKNGTGTNPYSPAGAIIGSNGSVLPGETFIFTLKGKALSAVALEDVKWSDTLDSRLTFVDSAKKADGTPLCTFAAGTVTCLMGKPALASQYEASFRVKVKDTLTAAQFGELSNSATVFTGTEESAACSALLSIVQPGSAVCAAKEAYTDFASVSTSTQIVADTAVAKDQQYTYRIFLGPLTQDATQDITITDTLPAQLSYVESASNIPNATSTLPGTITYTAGTNKVTINLGKLHQSAAAKLLVAEFKVKVKTTAAAGAFTNTATVQTGGTNNSACSVALKIDADVTPTPSTIPGSGFYVIKYNDVNGDGLKQDTEVGMNWKFEWSLNDSTTWTGYETFEKDGGKGGIVGGLKAGDKIVIREKGVDGWSSTTPNEIILNMKAVETVKVEFGNRQKTSPGCNNSCATTSDCGSGLTCTNGTCRNNACSAKTNCVCDVTGTTPPAKTAATPPATTLPVAGSVAETFGTVAVGVVITILGVIGLFAL